MILLSSHGILTIVMKLPGWMLAFNQLLVGMKAHERLTCINVPPHNKAGFMF